MKEATVQRSYREAADLQDEKDVSLEKTGFGLDWGQNGRAPFLATSLPEEIGAGALPGPCC